MLRMDLQFFSQEKTEKATPKKRQDARQKGQVVKSPEVTTSLGLLLAFVFLMITGKSFVVGIMDILRRCFQDYLLMDLTIPNVQLMFNQLLLESVKMVAPFFAVMLVVGVLSNYVQIGFLFTTESLAVQLGKLNPIEGAKKLVSLRSFVELLKSLFKIAITSGIAFWLIWRAKNQLFSLGQKEIWDAASIVGSLMIQLGVTIAGLLFIMAVFDYLYQRYEFEKQLKMSKQDIKDEYKKSEGDPAVKGKRKQKQRQLAMGRMLQEVPKADVVITNPTHFAIAIRYDIETMDAPEVIAKGKDHIALKIREIAGENQIMMVENKPLARALYASVEIGEPVPEELFHAVAEILAYVYYQEGRYKGMMA
ncbi:MAG TPA: flagellar biosynthesis protein FlhB [Bacillota bacterium]|nr:flagellar biosynthesis protein FlhB [Bacillota bacterium]